MMIDLLEEEIDRVKEARADLEKLVKEAGDLDVESMITAQVDVMSEYVLGMKRIKDVLHATTRGIDKDG